MATNVRVQEHAIKKLERLLLLSSTMKIIEKLLLFTSWLMFISLILVVWVFIDLVSSRLHFALIYLQI